MSRAVLPGHSAPLGATPDGRGTNFAVVSESATRVELCLFDGAGHEERVRLHSDAAGVWSAYLPGVQAGQRYGYRAHGPYDPAHGQRHNAAKLLVDPYARALDGPCVCRAEHHGYTVGDAAKDLSWDARDSAPFTPKAIVLPGGWGLGPDPRPRTPWADTVIYEAHVKGLTAQHPGVPQELRGTYLGLAAPAVIEHLKGLGVTALELLPVAQSATEPHLLAHGLSNYWGYSPLAFGAPDGRFATGWDGRQVREFQTMVHALHHEGIEVYLDVVYNHTVEGNQLGPTLSLRGLDNRAYYHLASRNPREYVDFTGCGNTLNGEHPRAWQLILDSLRRWVTDLHVDGFRFDLAPAMLRDGDGKLQRGLLNAIEQDPVLGEVKLIAEPWDAGHGGYLVGGFGPRWGEWNGPYRDCIRRFWRGEPLRAELASRLAGSSDIFGGPESSVNFVTCHDGFTLRDLVSYDHKHNEANGEQNRDGTDANYSRNWGEEGPTRDPRRAAQRLRVMRCMLATLAVSQGVPMLAHGDELGRTQGGNNNAYCQDGPLSWVAWNPHDAEARELCAFAQAAFGLRRQEPGLRRREYFHGRTLAEGPKDVAWIRPDGGEFDEGDWSDPQGRALGMLIPDAAIDAQDAVGHTLPGHTLLVLLNGGLEPQPFRYPQGVKLRWEVALATDPVSLGGFGVEVPSQAVVVLRGVEHG